MHTRMDAEHAGKCEGMFCQDGHFMLNNLGETSGQAEVGCVELVLGGEIIFVYRSTS